MLFGPLADCLGRFGKRDPHAPYAPPEPFATRFASDPYSGEIAYVDENLGRLLRTLSGRGEMDRTLIILTADHGEALGDHGEMTHGYFAYNSTLWVPLIIYGPKLRPARINAPVSHADIFPTVCDLTGLPEPSGLTGRSLRRLLMGRSLGPRPIYFEALEGFYHRGAAPLRGIIDGSWKYLETPIPELYDISRDFRETRNLAASADLIPFKRSLERELREISVLRGEHGARMNDPETTARLRSLGYVASPAGRSKEDYGVADDLKTLLPLEQKLVRAGQLAKSGKSDESVRLLEDIIRARPDFTWAYAQLAETWFSIGRMEAHLRVLEQGVQANPADFMLASALGAALVERGDYRAGTSALRRALDLFDGDPGVWGSLGEASWKMGEFEMAAECFRRALALAPEDAIINGNAGNFYVDMGMKDRRPELIKEALARFKIALASDPSFGLGP